MADRKTAQEAERLYALIESDMKAIATLTADHHSYKTTLTISATPHKKLGEYYHPKAIDLPIRGDALMDEVKQFAVKRATAAFRARIAESNRRLAQIGFQKVEKANG